jgi:hypothetical protein
MIDKDRVPGTFDQAVQWLLASLDDDAIKRIREGDEPSHHGFGTMLRNNWSLWERGTPFDLDFRARFGLSHGDDKSGLIFTAVTALVRGEDVEAALAATVERYKRHWASYNVDPLTCQLIRKEGDG